MAVAFKSKFPNLLDKAIDKTFLDALANTESEYQKLAKQEAALPGESIVESEISGLGNLNEVPEGGRVDYDLPEEGHKKARYYTNFGLGFQVTEQMIQDEVHDKIMKMPAALGEAAVQKINVEFFDLFNSGFSGELAWDGKAIFADDHVTLKSGDTIANEPSSGSDLSETTLQAAFEYFDKLKTESGYPMYLTPQTLLVPVEERWMAMKLMSGDRVLGSANNDPLTTNPSAGMVPGWTVMVSRYLTDEDAWFLLSDKHDFRLVFKKKPTQEKSDDFDTGNRLYKVTTRFAKFCNQYKGAYGNPGP
jgi:phage major head subunit gpT-like protein